MTTVKIVFRQVLARLLAGLSDYMTQGKTLKQLKENLKDIYKDVTGGHVLGVRKVDDLVIS